MQHLQQDLQDQQLIVLQMVSAEAMATVRRVTVMDRDAETDRDTTEATVRRATVTDRDAAEIVRDITEATVRRMVDVTAVEDRAQEVVQAVR